MQPVNGGPTPIHSPAADVKAQETAGKPTGGGMFKGLKVALGLRTQHDQYNDLKARVEGNKVVLSSDSLFKLSQLQGKIGQPEFARNYKAMKAEVRAAQGQHTDFNQKITAFLDGYISAQRPPADRLGAALTTKLLTEDHLQSRQVDHYLVALMEDTNQQDRLTPAARPKFEYDYLVALSRRCETEKIPLKTFSPEVNPEHARIAGEVLAKELSPVVSLEQVRGGVPLQKTPLEQFQAQLLERPAAGEPARATAADGLQKLRDALSRTDIGEQQDVGAMEAVAQASKLFDQAKAEVGKPEFHQTYTQLIKAMQYARSEVNRAQLEKRMDVVAERYFDVASGKYSQPEDMDPIVLADIKAAVDKKMTPAKFESLKEDFLFDLTHAQLKEAGGFRGHWDQPHALFGTHEGAVMRLFAAHVRNNSGQYDPRLNQRG